LPRKILPSAERRLQVSGLILAGVPKLNEHAPVAAYQAVFWLCLGAVGLSIILVS
jgi:hypothetical protein